MRAVNMRCGNPAVSELKGKELIDNIMKALERLKIFSLGAVSCMGESSRKGAVRKLKKKYAEQN